MADVEIGHDEIETTCPKCGKLAVGVEAIQRLFGFRNIRRGALEKPERRPQSQCKDCRAASWSTWNADPRGMPHLERRGPDGRGGISWVHAEVCWCTPLPSNMECFTLNQDASFRWRLR